MIDINELRQLVQAATPGPWVSHGRYIGTPRHMSYVGEVRDQCGNWSDTEKSRADAAFIAAANPAAISELLDRLEAAEKERDSYKFAFIEYSEKTEWVQRGVNDGTVSAKYLGWHRADVMSDLLSAAEKERDALRAELDALKAWKEEVEKQEPLAWRTFDGEGGYDYRGVDGNEDYRDEFIERNPKHANWVDALYASPVPAQSVPAEVVGYLDLGVGGYIDIGSDLSDEELSKLPKGRHALAIVGTWGVDGYVPIPAQSVPDERAAFEAWARPRWIHPEDFNKRIKDRSKYNNYELQSAWDAWSARANLDVVPKTEAKP